jgi:hypothetical protein
MNSMLYQQQQKGSFVMSKRSNKAEATSSESAL